MPVRFCIGDFSSETKAVELYTNNLIWETAQKNGYEIIEKRFKKELFATDFINRIEELKKIIKPYVQNQEAIETLTEETDFIKDLQINSANLVDIVLDIEEMYEIVIDNPSMERMINVKAALEIIDAKLNE